MPANWAKGTGLPRLSTSSSMRDFNWRSSRLTRPWSKPMAPISSFHGEGSGVSSSLAGNWKSQLARPSARRRRSALGRARVICGMTMRFHSSGSGARRNSTLSRLAKRSARVWPAVQSGLPRVRSLAWKRGHGTQARQPSSPGSRVQTTRRSPLMAKGRLSAAETFSLSRGLARFQSKVAMNTTPSASRQNRAAKAQSEIFRPRVMLNSLSPRR
ncbi:hypothetical protein D9M71_431630 [compost metagenome]